MKRFIILLCLPAFFGQILWGCGGRVPLPEEGQGGDAVFIVGADYRQRGSVAYESGDERILSTTGCEVVYTLYQSSMSAEETLVVLGHGFMRSKQKMAHLAHHLASWGLAVANVEFCNSKLWAGNHDRNGADMVAVSQKLKADNVIYVGFSAGGLAAMVAANLDESTRAIFGLDLVDHRELGNKTAPALKIPFYGLMAAPSACNAYHNGLENYLNAPDSRVIEVTGASHCHFEFPADGKCFLVCGRGENQISHAQIQRNILGLTTAFLLWQTGIDGNGRTWWMSNQANFQRLKQAEIIINNWH